MASRARRRPGTLPFDGADARLAAAAWSRLTEPGDLAAGILRRELGDVAALDWLLHLETQPQPGNPPGWRTAGPPERSADGGTVVWASVVARWLPRLAVLDVRRELDTLHRCGGHLVTPEDDEWPARLHDLGDTTPPALWVRGRLSPRPRAVAVVGARAATPYGEHLAVAFGHGLGEAGVDVVSGGAYGIDAAAHRGALAADAPTWAFLAGGVDRLYPAGNTALLESVIATGAVLSEVPCGSAPMRSRFLQRNRLIAAAAGVVVVVEAAWRSGAINTASHAARLLRSVGAVPGPVTSMASAGCHRLLREHDAVCVTEVAEVLELLAPAGEHLPEQPELGGGLLDGLDPLARQLLDALPMRAAAPVASLARASGLSTSEVRSTLGHLELAGRAERHGTGWRRRRER